ncbi:MAG: hypothetical protein ACTSQJ_00360 [Promethearchaeota archaeon]
MVIKIANKDVKLSVRIEQDHYNFLEHIRKECKLETISDSLRKILDGFIVLTKTPLIKIIKPLDELEKLDLSDLSDNHLNSKKE